MLKKAVTVFPPRIDQWFTNPGIGFTAAHALMDAPAEIRDTKGRLVEPYRFTPTSKTWNHPDSRLVFFSVRWRDIEPVKGDYRWELIEQKLSAARSQGCTAIVRCSPYALQLEDDIPQWLRDMYPEEPSFPFWRIDPNTTPYADYWAEFIRAFAEKFDGHPIISSIDLTIVGAWGEGGGTEFMNPDAISKIVDAYMDGFKLTPLQSLLHDPMSSQILLSKKRNVGFRVDCLGDMGGFHGKRWSHMTDFYPQNIQNFGMSEAWKKAPIVFEACWHMQDWYDQGWDIEYIIEESLKWHISSFNSKATVVPKPWQPAVENWLKRMGYRFELRKFVFDSLVTAGEALKVMGLWANVGVAPIYSRYPLVVRLVSENGQYAFRSQQDIRQWLPEEDVWWEESFTLPDHLVPGTYEIQIGIETEIAEVGNVRLAIEGWKDGYYPMGHIVIERGLD